MHAHTCMCIDAYVCMCMLTSLAHVVKTLHVVFTAIITSAKLWACRRAQIKVMYIDPPIQNERKHFLESTFCSSRQHHEMLSTASVTDIIMLYVFYDSRMESTEKCDAVISHFNGKFLKTPPGVPGNYFILFSNYF